MRVAASEKVILSLLIQEGPSYGLQLINASKGQLKRGGIYVTLGRMEEKGLVTSAPTSSGRRLYEPTTFGERALMAARLFAGEIKIGVA